MVDALVGWMEGIFVWLKIGMAALLWVWALIVLPSLIFRKTRLFGAMALTYSSFYSGLSCWWFCFILCYRVFGGFWLLGGLLFAGVGVVPLAFFGLIVKSLWTPGLGFAIFDVFTAIMLFAVPRWLGVWIVYRCEKRREAEEDAQLLADTADFEEWTE